MRPHTSSTAGGRRRPSQGYNPEEVPGRSDHPGSLRLLGRFLRYVGFLVPFSIRQNAYCEPVRIDPHPPSAHRLYAWTKLSSGVWSDDLAICSAIAA